MGILLGLPPQARLLRLAPLEKIHPRKEVHSHEKIQHAPPKPGNQDTLDRGRIRRVFRACHPVLVKLFGNTLFGNHYLLLIPFKAAFVALSFNCAKKDSAPMLNSASIVVLCLFDFCYLPCRCGYNRMPYRHPSSSASSAPPVDFSHCCWEKLIYRYDTGLQGHRIPVNSAVVPCSRYSQGSVSYMRSSIFVTSSFLECHNSYHYSCCVLTRLFEIL